MGNTAKQCRLGLFQDSEFAGDLEDWKSTSGGTLCIFGSHTFVPISWMCKKQTSVSHSSTESEIISLDAGLRLDWLHALELWDLIVSVLGNISHISDRTGQPVNGKNKSHNKIDVMQDIDSVPSNVQSARQEALLYVFEDNEAVIKMIMKGRSPTMRHVSRTHRVALYWLFDRINLDPKIQIKYIDTKNQLADMLTKGNFTRDEWNHLLTLFNISHFSSTACIAAMAKRAQQESREGRVTAKSRPMMNLTARTPSCLFQPHQTLGGPRMDIKILNNLFLTIERGNPWKCQDQTTLRITVHPGLLKCGKVEMEITIDQGNLIKILGIHWEKLTLIVENIFSAKGLFLSVYVDDIKLAGKKHNIDPMWKVLNKEVDLGEPTSFLDHVYLGCTQRQCEVSQNIVDNYRTMFESRISVGGFGKITILSKYSYFFVIL